MKIRKKKTPVFEFADVGPPSLAHTVRAFHPLRLPVLRVRVLDDDRGGAVQRRLPLPQGLAPDTGNFSGRC